LSTNSVAYLFVSKKDKKNEKKTKEPKGLADINS